MGRLSVARSFAAVVVAAALVSAGCVYVPGPEGIAGPRGQYGPPGAVMQIGTALGVSAGLLSASDETLTGGFYLGGHLALRLNDFMAIEAGAGFASMQDDWYGGDLNVTPMTVAVVLSMPDPYNPGARYRVGVGRGVAGLDHTDYSIDSMDITVLQFGAEIVLPSAGGGPSGRGIAVMDMMIGDVVSDQSASANWDLRSLFCFRVGMEFSF